MNERQFSQFVRFTRDLNDTTFIARTKTKVVKTKDIQDQLSKEMEEKKVVIAEGSPAKISVAFKQALYEKGSLLVKDDLQFWEDNQVSEHGRLLFVDPDDHNTIQIFFDDQATGDDKSIVNVKETGTFTSIPPLKALNKYTVKVETLEAISDEMYFIKKLEICEAAQNELIERAQRGLKEDEPLHVEKSDWEKLSELNDTSYLRKVVMPIIYPAYQLLNLHRPEDPLTFLAGYLLRHKDSIIIPEKPVKKEIVEEQKEPEVKPEPVVEEKPQVEEKPTDKKDTKGKQTKAAAPPKKK